MYLPWKKWPRSAHTRLKPKANTSGIPISRHHYNLFGIYLLLVEWFYLIYLLAKTVSTLWCMKVYALVHIALITVITLNILRTYSPENPEINCSTLRSQQTWYTSQLFCYWQVPSTVVSVPSKPATRIAWRRLITLTMLVTLITLTLPWWAK